MQAEVLFSFLAFATALFFAALLAGYTSTSTSVLYDTPNWMLDGRIIQGKLFVTTSQQLYGGGVSGSHSYVTALTINNSGEVTNVTLYCKERA